MQNERDKERRDFMARDLDCRDCRHFEKYVLIPGMLEQIQKKEDPASANSPAVESTESNFPSGYFLPTGTEYISDADLSGFTKEEVSLIRNELFAHHGCCFQSEAIRTYFEEQSWYEPVPGVDSLNFDAAAFNEFEMKNLAVILEYERSMGWR